MNGKQLSDRLKQFGNLEVPDDTIIGWIDSAQKSVSIELPVTRQLIINLVTENRIVTVPTGVFSIVSATYESGEYPLTDIKVSNDSLTFLRSAASITVEYTTITADYTKLEDELTIHPSLHALVLYYLISMYYEMEGEGDNEESGLAERYYQKWLYDKSQAINRITNEGNDLSLQNPVSTIDVLPKSYKRTVKESFYE